MMKSLTLLLSLFFAADVTVNHVYAQLDIKELLQTLKHQLHQRDDQLEQVRDKDDKKDDDDDNDDNRFGSLRVQEIEKLIKQALHNNNVKSNKISSNKRQKYSGDDQVSESANIYTLWQSMNNKQDDDDDDDATLDRLFGVQTNEQKEKRRKKNARNVQQNYLERLNQILQDNVNKPKHNSRKKPVPPGDLLEDTYYPDVINRADPNDLNDYSKVYVILNVDAIQESKNPNQLNDVLSTLLKSSSSQRDRHGRKERRYKGFLLSDAARRASRDSPEAPYAKDSDLDYKPKRSRNRGGGGDPGGRTPIPYIRHRGDIYEKEK